MKYGRATKLLYDLDVVLEIQLCGGKRRGTEEKSGSFLTIGRRTGGIKLSLSSSFSLDLYLFLLCILFLSRIAVREFFGLDAVYIVGSMGSK